MLVIYFNSKTKLFPLFSYNFYYEQDGEKFFSSFQDVAKLLIINLYLNSKNAYFTLFIQLIQSMNFYERI